jgi:uncharacterized DUF497 family protein
MKGREFEWHDAKAAENLRHHGVAFEKAVKAFDDPFAIEWIDQSELTARSGGTFWVCARASSCT